MKFTAIGLMLVCILNVECQASPPLFTERVTINPATGVEADGSSNQPVLSADGCIVVFQSQSTTLADARFSVTKSSPPQIYAVDRCVTPHTMELISVTNDGSATANGYCEFPNVSTDGRYVAFYSYATNLPSPGGSSNSGVIFIRDRLAQTTTSPLASWRSTANVYTNTNKPYLSADAKYMVLDFEATGVPHNIYRFDLSTSPPTLQPICPSAAMSGSGACEDAVISGDGSTILFDTYYAVSPADTNTFNDIYAYDATTATSQLTSVNADGSLSNDNVGFNGSIALSNDGHVAIFHNNDASNLTGGDRTILIKDLTTGQLSSVSQRGKGVTMDPPSTLSVSGDGQRVGFTPNTVYPLVHSRTDAVVYDTQTQRLISMCLSSQAIYGNADCSEITLSADGNWAVYASSATNLVPGITNTIDNVFVSAISPVLDLVFTDDFESSN
jgi:hypothetical protein